MMISYKDKESRLLRFPQGHMTISLKEMDAGGAYYREYTLIHRGG